MAKFPSSCRKRPHRCSRLQATVSADPIGGPGGFLGGPRLRPRRDLFGRLRGAVLPDISHEPHHCPEMAEGRRGEEAEATSGQSCSRRRRGGAGERGTGKEWPETERQWRRALGRRELLWRRGGRRDGAAAAAAVDQR